MLRTMIKAAAYAAAPRTTFVLAHPAKALKLTKMRWDMKHAAAPRIAAVGAALGAAALAMPLGLALGRLRGRARVEQH